MSSDQAVDSDLARCPICGEQNQCAMAADPEATECWCESAIFPQDLLKRLPVHAVRRVCICQRCIETHRKKSPD